MYRYKVSDNKLLTPSVRSLTLRCDDSSAPLLYEPGQYAAISLHDLRRPTATRCFSMASSPADRHTLEFCVRVNGAYTSALERLKPGDTVGVRGPFGNFTLKEDRYNDLVFFAGGIGITPFMSMIRYAADLRLQNNIHLIYNCRSQDDIPFFEELVALQEQNSHFRVTFVITSGGVNRLHGLKVVAGRIDSTTVRTLGLNYARETYMICGPTGYIHGVRNLLDQCGVSHDRILSEAFSQGSRYQNDALLRWPVNMYALSGLSLLIAGFFVVERDLAKTLPIVQAQYEPAQSTIGTSSGGPGGSVASNVQTLPPQVDTNIKQEPIKKHIARSGAAPTKITVPAPVVQRTPAPQVVTPKPVPAPKPTVKPTTRPRTQVS